MTAMGKAAPDAAGTTSDGRDMKLHFDHDDRSRAQFIVALKRKTNFGVAKQLEQRFNDVIAPDLAKDLGRPLSDTSREDRKLAKAVLENEHLYRVWGCLTYIGQDMMWDCVETIVGHELPRLEANAAYYFDRNDQLGSLELNPTLPLPANIAKTEIHRQPGGFCFERHDRDILSGVRYNGGGMMYTAGKGRTSIAGVGGGDFVIEKIRERFPGFTPKRILEIGCGTGRNTPSYKRLFPDAEITAIDCAAGLLRFAFANAESEGTAIHFKQMDLTKLGFADDSFDMVVSHIVGHETTHKGLPLMIAESWRVLAPGGVMFHLDVPTQPTYQNLFNQVLNDYQVRYNGEPFWMGWADADVRGIMTRLGVPEDAMIADALSPAAGGVSWFCHGGRKPADARGRKAA